MGRFQLLNLGVLGYGLELRYWVVIAIIWLVTEKGGGGRRGTECDL